MPNVAFCRTLKPGMRGADIVAHKRAVSRNLPKTYPWYAFTDFYGPAFQGAVKTFQHLHGIPQTGVIGTTTHLALEKARARNKPKEWAFDAFAVKLAKDFCADYGTTPEQQVRDAIVAAGLFWYGHRMQIAYSQYRPFWLGHPPSFPSRWDCSGFVTACYYAGGADDPNGRGYDHLGYTGTLMSRGERVSGIGDLSLADLIFYGSSSGRPGFAVGAPTHVAALYIGKDTHGTPMVLSMGSYPMGLYPYNYRPVNHLRHYTITGGAL